MISRRIFYNLYLLLGVSVVMFIALGYSMATGAKVMFFQGAMFQLRVAGAVLFVVAATLMVRMLNIISQAIYALPEGLL
jgi:hypothetical protein